MLRLTSGDENYILYWASGDQCSQILFNYTIRLYKPMMPNSCSFVDQLHIFLFMTSPLITCHNSTPAQNVLLI